MLKCIAVDNLHDDLSILLKTTISGMFIRLQKPTLQSMNSVKGYFDVKDQWKFPLFPNSPKYAGSFMEAPQDFRKWFENSVKHWYQRSRENLEELTLCEYRSPDDFAKSKHSESGKSDKSGLPDDNVTGSNNETAKEITEYFQPNIPLTESDLTKHRKRLRARAKKEFRKQDEFEDRNLELKTGKYLAYLKKCKQDIIEKMKKISQFESKTFMEEDSDSDD
jgi:hypothetical protein